MAKSKSGSAKKRSKKYATKSVKPVTPPMRAITPMGMFIHRAMAEHKSPGSWRDYVLFVGDEMLEAWGKYNIIRMGDDGKPAQVTPLALLHKRNLHEAIGDVPAARFWDRKLNRRTNHGLREFYRGKQATKEVPSA